MADLKKYIAVDNNTHSGTLPKTKEEAYAWARQRFATNSKGNPGKIFICEIKEEVALAESPVKVSPYQAPE